jgi:hypothetical protein
MSAFTDYILVNCGLTARFSNNKGYIASETNIYNDTILFTNNSMSTLGSTPVSYQWALTNNVTFVREIISTNAVGPGGPDDLNYRFPTFGNFRLRLIATGGGCADSSDSIKFYRSKSKTRCIYRHQQCKLFSEHKSACKFLCMQFGLRYDTCRAACYFL